MVEIGKRIAEVRNYKGKTQQDLANFLGVDVKKIGRIERGETKTIKNNDLKLISNFLNIPIEYLLDMNMSVSNVSKSSVSQPQNVSKSLTKQDLNVNKSDSISSHTNTDDSIQIPIFDVYASAGHGLINEEHIESYATFDKSFLRKNFGLTSFVELSIITSKGDSMIPTLPENCQLLIQKGLPREGQICVTRIDDELYIKRLQKLPRYKLISDNNRYDDIDLDGRDYEILGIVVGMFQKMT